MSFAFPTGAWDSHIHCFDPERHPFKENRAYTPPPATLDKLLQQSQVDRLMLVQASVENGFTGILSHITRCRQQSPHMTIRGTICNEPGLSQVSEQDFDRLHEIGIRSIRLHGTYGMDGCDLVSVKETLEELSQCIGITKHGWTISAQLPLPTWAALKDFIIHSLILANVTFIADHNLSATPDDIDSVALDAVVELLKAGKLYVKVCALYRRSEDISQMKQIVQMYANAAPRSLLWGSDWPHVSTKKRATVVDINKELLALQDWLSEEQWQQMLVENPETIYT
ncbi:hypothetical protein ASPWEDRAFT_148037 [Aspergillus wentii DTO 134E9]|uniref:Amidohydrolase-related domain-containing protein n=1 Tax=Aspergillus wentii DTO 134E9 TaxID=1073089 RepID=A0A1L9S4A0_ASPWE|nr:uncharacterized protein ASPWEDRAFT_148037 [Aspergillus wentii DTO 134E9]KAI9930276.1 hypothetical protein MW887_012089 [Aspergillus wentii]OJJ41953.1 hypothetical protein ASPWEDRAFT_148037 [Aspergillus wentii DTO 134E9]